MTLFTDLKNAGLPVISASDTQATFSRSLTDVESELYHDILDPTRAAKRNDETMARVQLRAEYLSTITTLPGGATLTYNVTSGYEGAMVPTSTWADSP